MPDLDLLGQGHVVSRYTPGGGREVPERYSCPPGDCIAHPKIQTLSGLPSRTSAPNTVITSRAVRALRAALVPDGWLIQTTGPLTPGQINAARQLALVAQSRVETSSGSPGPSQITGGATAAAIVLALGVLAMTAGLIRAETAGDLRTLTAAAPAASQRRRLSRWRASVRWS